MSYIKRLTTVKPASLVEVKYELRSGLFGLLKWREEVSALNIENRIYIETDSHVTKIYVNEEEYVPKQYPQDN